MERHFEALQAKLKSHVPVLDGVRGFAILYVVFHNVAAHGLDNVESLFFKLYYLLVDMGWIGVQLFFVLSGFLITGILLRSKGKPQFLRNFYVRRSLRIFPIFYVSLLLLFTLPQLFSVNAPWLEHSANYQVWYWLYLINWIQPFDKNIELGHFWSLAIEEQFYLLWPLLVLFLSKSNLLRLCILLIITAFLARIVFAYLDPILSVRAAYTITVFRWDGLAMGALLAIVLRDENYYCLLKKYAKTIVYICLACVPLAILATSQFTAIAKSFYSPAILNLTVVSILGALLIYYLLITENKRNLVSVLFSGAVLRFFGKYSYAMYIIHIPMEYVWFASDLALPTAGHDGVGLLFTLLGNFIMVLLLTTLLAMISWQLVEKPFLNLKRHFS